MTVSFVVRVHDPSSYETILTDKLTLDVRGPSFEGLRV